MAAIVCHGLQSSLESQLVESRKHWLRLNSPKPKPIITHPPLQTQTQPMELAFKSCLWEPNTKLHSDENINKTDTNTDSSNPNQGGVGGWNFIQSLSNASQSQESTNTYVHPQVKQSSLRLSPKSLELCTENLGNETGTHITDTTIDFLSTNYSSHYSGRNLEMTLEPIKTRLQLLGDKKKTKPRNFPPPLTTMRGSESLQVRPHREGGRLVIEVTRAPLSASCFRAERSNGRLRLCLLENHPPYPSSFEMEEEEEEDDDEIFEGEFESKGSEQRQDVEEEETEEEGGIENSDRDAFGMIMEKYERGVGGRRCKEGDRENNELLLINHWGKSLWVATS